MKELLVIVKQILDFELINLSNFNLTVAELLLAFVIILTAQAINRFAKMLISKTFEKRTTLDKGKLFTVQTVVKYIIYFIAVLLMLQTLGLNLSLLLASGAALFVGIGLGLQNTFNDIISGFILLFEGSLLVGDIVEIESLVGRVEQIDIRTSKIKTRDGILIVVPNSKLINNNVINWTNSDALTRFNVSVGVAYGSNTELVKTTLEKVVLKHPEVSNKKPVRVRFENFGDSSLDFKVFFWTDRTWEIEFIKSELRFEIDKAFRANNITIPFPQRDLHIISNQAK